MIERARFEKFSRTLIVVEASDRSYGKFLGHRLEIVPRHPGAWRVRVEQRMSVAAKDYDLHVLKAVLVFPVE
jgi:hypothetical protein